jgi:hypothetical protein
MNLSVCLPISFYGFVCNIMRPVGVDGYVSIFDIPNIGMHYFQFHIVRNIAFCLFVVCNPKYRQRCSEVVHCKKTASLTLSTEDLICLFL